VKRLLLVIVEAAVELVPRELLGHPAVRKHAARTGKDPSRMLLDRSYHHAAMRRLEDSAKRGRPDIPYHILLDAVDSPLYASGGLGLYVSTRDGMVLEVGERVRLPRSYHRFVGLLEDLYVKELMTSLSPLPSTFTRLIICDSSVAREITSTPRFLS